MATRRALMGSNSPAGIAYGLVADPPYQGAHLIIAMRSGERVGIAGHDRKLDGTVSDVSYDDAADVDALGLVPGHPGLVALKLSGYTVVDTVATYTDYPLAPGAPDPINDAVAANGYTAPTPDPLNDRCVPVYGDTMWP